LPGVAVPATGKPPWDFQLPNELAVSADALWLGTHGAGVVYRVDPTNNQVVAMVVLPGKAASSLAVQGNAVWVGQCLFGDTGVIRIDATTNTVAATIPGPNACGLAADNDAVWATDTSGDALWRIDPATNTVVAKVALPAGASPVAVATGFGSVWVVNVGTGTVSRIDPATNAIVATLAVGATFAHSGAEAITDDGRSIWVANDVDNKLYRIDPATNTVTALEVGARDRGDWRVFSITYGLGSLWARTGACEVAQIDTTTSSVVKRIKLCANSGQTASIAAAFNSLWVTYPTTGGLRRLQP
jgi:DNA-binding beta-propeller fold protein YncE